MAGVDRRALALAALAALVARLAFGLLYWTGQPLTRDEVEYLSLARSMAAGAGFTYDAGVLAAGDEPFGRAPGYPAFLAVAGGAGAVPTSVPAAVKISQSLVGALGVLLLAAIAGRLAGPRAALFAAWMGALEPPLVWVAGYALSEGIFWPLAMGTVWLFDRGTRDRTAGPWWMAAAGVAAGAGVLVRPAMLFFLILAGPWLLWRRRVWLALALAVGSALVILPWTARNAVHYGRFVLVASEGGVTFWTGNHPRATGDGDLAANPHLKIDRLALRARHPDLTEEEMEPVYYREAMAWIRREPVEWLALEMRKLFYFVVPAGPSYTLHSPLYVAGSVAPYLVLLPIACVGWIRLGPARRRSPGLWLLVASTALMALVFFPQERFRIPVIDPALIVLASAALASWRRPGSPA